jgi:transcriptional regulator with XRE-family HTH domain
MSNTKEAKIIREKAMSKEGLEKITDMASKGCGFSDIADALGVNFTTLWKWRKDNPDIDKAFLDGYEASIVIVENALFKNATKGTAKMPYGNVTAQIFFLCNRAPDRWKSSIKGDISVNGQVEGKLTGQFGDLTDAQLKVLANDLLKDAPEVDDGKKGS